LTTTKEPDTADSRLGDGSTVEIKELGHLVLYVRDLAR
jgi:hypothetical protein